MNIRILSQTLLLVALLLSAVFSRADDTDIYFRGGQTGVNPVVMFYIEYSPNLTSTICTGVATDGSDIDTTCPQMSGLKLYLSKPTAANPTASDDLADGVIDQFEMTRAALKRVLISLGDMKVGIITAHNNNAGCAGPTMTGCSNGGEIYSRALLLSTVSSTFNPLDQTQIDAVLTADPNKARLFRRLDRMRSPQGNFSAPNQNKEIYFELYRYLTGRAVYNGHNGWTDFSTSSTYNLGQWDTSVSTIGNYDCQTGSDCSSVTSGGTYIYNKGAGVYYGDFVETPAKSGLYIPTEPLKWDVYAEDDNGNYVSPITADCQKIFMVNVVDGAGVQANDSDSAIDAGYNTLGGTYANGGMNMTVAANDAGFVQMVKWMYEADLANASTYTDTTNGPISKLDFADKQNVTSYFIANQPQQVDAAALAGTGGANTALALTTDPQQTVDNLKKVFNQILSVSTTFVAASIPVNVFNRSEVIDNAYIALFQANEAAQPQWVGDVKKLKLSIIQVQVPIGTDASGNTVYQSQNQLQLVDANSQPAIASDGRIMQTALTFWTNPLGYDLYDSLDTTETAGADGRSVNRGGAGEQIPGFLDSTQTTINGLSLYPSKIGSLKNDGTILGSKTPRQLFTNAGGAFINLDMSNAATLWPLIFDKNDPASLAPWSKAPSYATLTGDYTTDVAQYYLSTGCFTYYTLTSSYYYNSSCWIGDELSNVVSFIRGLDVSARAYTSSGAIDITGTNVLRNKTRRWAFGDPLHSRPLPINYGARPGYSTSNPDIRILVGSNDGFMRMIRNTNSNGSESGQEVWAFMPDKVLRIQKILKDNIANSNPIHPYGLDGAPTAYVVDSDGTIDPAQGDKVWLFFGLRRGGRAYYALDITDPDHPKFKWKIDQNTSGFSELGYTFSQPVVRDLDWGLGRRPVLIVGGGYDTNKDATSLGTDDTIGNALFIIDADTGALVWKAVKTTSTGTSYINSGLVDSIPSEVTAYDSTGDGFVDRVYVGDTGGSVWRADLPGTDRTQWTLHKILNVGRHYSATQVDDRRFFHAPDVVPTRDTVGLYDGVVIGSGDRAHPLETTTSNYMYMYKDRNVTGSSSATTLTHADLTDITNLNDCLIAGTCSPDLTNGWKLQLTQLGEKSLSTPLTLRGVVYFTTYIPQSGSCGPTEGTGRLYEVSLGNGTAANNFDTTNDNASGAVLTASDRYRALSSGGIPAESVYISYKDGSGNTFTGVLAPDLKAGTDLGAQQWRTYWYEKQ